MPRRDPKTPVRLTGYEITKQDVASSQLATSVWLWANEWDPVSVHVLASSAAEVIGVFRRTKSADTTSPILDALHGELAEQTEDHLKFSFNFMKYGAKDPSATLKFHPDESELMIYRACIDYMVVFGVASPEALLFLVYITDRWPFLMRKDRADPFLELRAKERSRAEGETVSRKDVARTLLDLHRFATHLKETGQHDYPLLRPDLLQRDQQEPA